MRKKLEKEKGDGGGLEGGAEIKTERSTGVSLGEGGGHGATFLPKG